MDKQTRDKIRRAEALELDVTGNHARAVSNAQDVLALLTYIEWLENGGAPARPAHEQKPAHELTDRQRDLLDAMQSHQAENHYPPTLRELGQATGIRSTSVVNYNLKLLENWGYIRREPGISRGLILYPPANQIGA